jgi:hypothetical protein
MGTIAQNKCFTGATAAGETKLCASCACGSCAGAATTCYASRRYYWDYQKMRSEYGPAELGTDQPIGMPPAPHPWCAGAPDEIADLVEYRLTL